MSTSPSTESPVDPGCLPAWETGELPAPIPFGWKNLLALLGPGLVMVGGSIGTGEWVMGPQAAQKYGGALLWVVPLSILFQVWLNTEAMRYTLVTGEPVFTGFMRSRPGPRFWVLWYLLLDFGSWWPALAGLSAQILLFAWLGPEAVRDPSQKLRVQLLACGVLLLCVVLLCFGGKIYNTLEWVLGGKVFFALGYTLFVAVFFVPAQVWGKVAGGMFDPFRVPMTPEGNRMPVDWQLIGALAGYAGVGGMGNILASNFVREKGWGMGSRVGAIASAFGGHQISLSHLGCMCRPTEEARRRFRMWWRYLTADQYGTWVWGSIFGMLLPCLIGAAFLQGDYVSGGQQWDAAARLAADLGRAKGSIFTTLTLICGFAIVFPGQLSSVDGTARRWCDALWSGSRRAHKADPGKVKLLYYSFVALYALAGIGLILSTGMSPPKMMVLAGTMANLSITSCIIQTLYVNMRFLPEEFRPPVIKRVALVLAALFFAGMFGIAVLHR